MKIENPDLRSSSRRRVPCSSLLKSIATKQAHKIPQKSFKVRTCSLEGSQSGGMCLWPCKNRLQSWGIKEEEEVW